MAGQAFRDSEYHPEGQTEENKSLVEDGALEERLNEIIKEQTTRSKISFGFVVLSAVAQEHYERAYAELSSVTSSLVDYPQFEREAQRFIEHAKGLVNAIKIKRSISLQPQINKSKKRELVQKIMEHFVDLRKSIIAIERIEKRVRCKDLSTSTIFLKTCFFAILAVGGCYFVYYEWPSLTAIPVDFFSYYLEQWGITFILP